MKLRFAFLGLLSLLAVSCSYEESFVPEDDYDNSAFEFYATIDEQPDADTKVYADDKLRILWNEDDRITIFNNFTYNQQYRFLGEDGDNAGAFRIVPTSDYVTGNDLDRVYSIYPYKETTKISYDGVLSFTFPSEQVFLENSFGKGANTMVSAASNNQLKFKNVGGYLLLKLYGLGVSVSSITLKSNNGELLSGPCTIATSSGEPVLTMSREEAIDQVSLICESPVALGATASEAVQFIFVLPPVKLTGGFTVIVNTSDGSVFEKTSNKERMIVRSSLTQMGAIEVNTGYDWDIVPSDLVTLHNPTKGGLEDVLLDIGGYDSISSLKVTGTMNDVDFLFIYRDMPNLKYLDISDINITSLPTKAFYNSTNVTHLILPKTLTEITDSEFYHSNLVAIKIMSNVLTIGPSAFGNCTSLEYVTFENNSGLKTICGGASGDSNFGAFYGCTALTSIIVPASVETIGQTAFKDCTSLSSVIFERNSKLKTIAGSAFGSSYYGAFYGCTALKSIVIPASVETIGQTAFKDCTSLLSVIFEDNSQLRTIEGGASESFKYIYGAFGGCTALTTIDFPASIETIGQGAFLGCANLKSVTFQKGSHLKTICGDGYGSYNVSGAFCYCSSLTTIEIPASVETINQTAFQECTSLSTVTFEKNSLLKTIEYQTFYNCFALSAIEIPKSVETIEYDAFANCTSLTMLSFEDGSQLKTIGFSAFSNLPALTTAVIPASVESIEYNAFKNCTSLATLIFDENSQLKTIGVSAFSDLQTLASLIIPASVETIETKAFSGCSSLTSVVFAANSQLQVLDDRVFEYCSSLRKVTFKENSQLIRIGTTLSSDFSPFYMCENLRTFDASGCVMLQEINGAVFYNLATLRLFYCGAEYPPTVNVSTFEGIDSYAILKVPDESVDVYKADTNWSSHYQQISGFNE